jgi:hypothetical protein
MCWPRKCRQIRVICACSQSPRPLKLQVWDNVGQFPREVLLTSRHVSVRVSHDTYEAMQRESRRRGEPLSRVMNTLLDEGVRMNTHPGVIFKPGPAGRRPALTGGPDIWEVMRVYGDFKEDGGDAQRRTAEYLSLSTDQIATAIRYYATYKEEIDEWTRQVDEDAAEAEAAWLREQALLQA